MHVSNWCIYKCPVDGFGHWTDVLFFHSGIESPFSILTLYLWSTCVTAAFAAVERVEYQSDPNEIDIYRKLSNIRRTLVGNEIVDHSDVVGASPVGAAPTTSSFST